MTTATPSTSERPGTAALGQRLRAVAAVLLPAAVPAATTGDLLDQLVRAVLDDPAPDRLWLLQVATSGRMPDADDADAARRAAELRTAAEFALWLLDDARAAAFRDGVSDVALEVVVDAVVVDVDYTAQHDLHSGIQRVVRSTLPHWVAAHGERVVPVVWVDGYRILRRLTGPEQDRVLRWDGPRALPPTAAGAGDDEPLVVPWRCTVVVPEVPWRWACERLAALGRHSGNRLVVIGYDCIPVVSAPTVPISEPNRFVHYLTMVKNADVVAAISASAAAEFAGFRAMLPTQGLAGPDVRECTLPVDTPSEAVAGPGPVGGVPLVVSVGSFEPRKNQLAVLTAAELLWREGIEFRLRFIGASGWGRELPRLLARLRRDGRPVEQLTAVSEATLDASYREARFTVFVSTHEGYGLPVAESLARGVPVLASDFGSIAEIAADGGTLVVDPRSVDAIAAGLRRLLLDDDLVSRLRDEITRREHGSWAGYADALWRTFDLDGAPGA